MPTSDQEGAALEPFLVEPEGSAKCGSRDDPAHSPQSALDLENRSKKTGRAHLTMYHSTLLSTPNQMIASLPFPSTETPEGRPGALGLAPGGQIVVGNHELGYFDPLTGEFPQTNEKRTSTPLLVNNVPRDHYVQPSIAGYRDDAAELQKSSREPPTSIRLEQTPLLSSASRPARDSAHHHPPPVPLPGGEAPSKGATRKISTGSRPTQKVRRNEGSPLNVTVMDALENHKSSNNKKNKAYQPCDLILQRQQRAAVAKTEKRHPEYFDWTADRAIQPRPLPPVLDERRRTMFPGVLYRLLETVHYANLDQICRWEPHGRSFAILNQQVFAQEIMPFFFERSNRYDSFRRQLNIYGFLRINSPKNTDEGAYYHEMFLRGRPEFCSHIERIIINGAMVRALPCYESEPDFGQFPSMPRFASAVPRRIHLSYAYVGLMHLGAHNIQHHQDTADRVLPEPEGEEMSETLGEENDDDDDDDLSLSFENGPMGVARWLDMAQLPVETSSQQGLALIRSSAERDTSTTATMITTGHSSSTTSPPKEGKGDVGPSDHCIEMSILTTQQPGPLDGSERLEEIMDHDEEDLLVAVVAPLTDEDQHQLTALLQNQRAVADLFHFP